MAKDKAQKELELEEKNKQKAENSDESEENASVGDEDSTQEDDVEKKIKELQEKLAKSDEDRKKDAEARKLAEERADRLEKERQVEANKAQQAEVRVATSQEEAIKNAEAAINSELEHLENDLQVALEGGDSKLVAQINRKLGTAAVKAERINDAKSQFEIYKKQQEDLAKQPKVQPLPPAVQKWIDNNPRYKSDAEFKAEADGAHDVAIGRGYAAGSTAYFNFIDGRLKQIFDTQKSDDRNEDDEERNNKRYSAPPNRGASSVDRDDDDGYEDTEVRAKKRVYKLTAEQREAAKFSNMTELEYATFLEAEKKRGKR